MIKQNDKENLSFFSKWIQRIDQSYCNSGTVILCGDRMATVYHCKKILSYSQEKIDLQVGRRCFSITGKGLYCSAFSEKTVTVEGEIQSTSWFSLAKKENP